MDHDQDRTLLPVRTVRTHLEAPIREGTQDMPQVPESVLEQGEGEEMTKRIADLAIINFKPTYDARLLQALELLGADADQFLEELDAIERVGPPIFSRKEARIRADIFINQLLRHEHIINKPLRSRSDP